MSQSARQAAESQILEIARRVAQEFSTDCDAEIRVLGWIGSTGQQGWEFAVDVDGKGFNFEVGESQVVGFSADEMIRREVESAFETK